MYKFYNPTNKRVEPKEEYKKYFKNQYDAYDILRECWCLETCAPRIRNEWHPINNYTRGQCSITSFLIQDYFGGDVYGVKIPGGGIHSFNVVDGIKFDLTSEQFPNIKLDYDDIIIQDRNVQFMDEDKHSRYQLLKELFEKKCSLKK